MLTPDGPGMGNMAGQDKDPLHKGNKQSRDDDKCDILEALTERTVQKKKNHEEDDRRQHCGNHRWKHFHGTLDRCIDRLEPFFVLLGDTFGNHDTVVDKNTDNEDHGQQ